MYFKSHGGPSLSCEKMLRLHMEKEKKIKMLIFS